AMIGLEHQVQMARGRAARQVVGVADDGRLGREDEDAVMVPLWSLLVAADRVGVGDHRRSLAAALLAAVREHDSSVLPRAESVVATDAPRARLDAGGRD